MHLLRTLRRDKCSTRPKIERERRLHLPRNMQETRETLKNMAAVKLSNPTTTDCTEIWKRHLWVIQLLWLHRVVSTLDRWRKLFFSWYPLPTKTKIVSLPLPHAYRTMPKQNVQYFCWEHPRIAPLPLWFTLEFKPTRFLRFDFISWNIL